jgi:hypothetical protein
LAGLAHPLLLIAVLTAAGLVAGCGDTKSRVNRASVVSPPKEEESFTSIDSPSLQFLPRQQEAPGWRLEEDPVVVPANRLVSFLGTDGSHFVHYEAIDLTQGKYAGVGNNGFATVEIFRFPDFVKSFGSYSTRKQGPVQFLPFVNEAFETRHSVHLWRGPFYVRVVGGGTPDGNQSLVRLVSFIADKMPAAPSGPAVFNFFPVSGRVPHSERYSTESGFGQTFLGNSFQATFDAAGSPIDGIIIPAGNRDAATRILNAYKTLYTHNGRLLDPVPNLGEDNFTAEDRYLGRAVAFRLDRFVIAFNGYKDRQTIVDLAGATDQRILGSIRKQLVSADKQEEAQAKARARGETTSTVPSWMQH